MAHAHSIYDTDKRFSIDPVTREIVNESEKFVLSHHDHNSERFTFSVPKEVDGHDMSICNRVQIHYLNIETGKDGLTYEGLYEVDDLQIDPDDSETVICSWLVSGNATQYEGSLLFAIHFACVADDGTVEYAWGTGPHSSVSIGKTIYNSEVIALEYADILEQWRNETFAMVEETLKEFSETGVGDGSITPAKLDRPYLSLGLRTQIPSGADLNDYLTPGCYCSYASSVSQTLLNSPTTSAFNLDVFSARGSALAGTPSTAEFRYFLQALTVATTGEKYYRTVLFNNSTTATFGAWKRILTTDDVQTYTATIPTSGWTMSDGWGRVDITVSGLLATDSPIVDVDLSTATDSNTIISQAEYWGNVFRVTALANKVRVYAYEAPSMDIPMKMVVIRK